MALRVTAKWLEKMKACEGQVELFKKVFPRGAAVTLKNLRKAKEAGLELYWLVDTLSNMGSYIDSAMWASDTRTDGPEMVMVGIKAMVKRGRKKLG